MEAPHNSYNFIEISLTRHVVMSFLNFLKRLLAEIKLGKGMTGFSKPRAHPLTQICNDRWSCVMNVTESETYTASHCIILSVTFCRFVHDSRAALEFETLCRSPEIKLLGDAFLSFSLSHHLERSYIGRKSSLYHPLPFKPATLILPHHCKRSLRQPVKDIWNKMQPTNPNAHTYAVTHNTFLQ